MGTYMFAVLKDKSEANIQKVNERLRALGVHFGTYNGVPYGAFNSMAMLNEDARYMNETTEGRKQMPDWKRPITGEQLSRNFAWKQLGARQFKLSASSRYALKQALIIADFIRHNRRLFSLKECSYHTMGIVGKYYYREHGNRKKLWKKIHRYHPQKKSS